MGKELDMGKEHVKYVPRLLGWQLGRRKSEMATGIRGVLLFYSLFGFGLGVGDMWSQNMKTVERLHKRRAGGSGVGKHKTGRRGFQRM